MLSEIKAGHLNYKVGIISAGSSDIGVANEAYFTLLYMGVNSKVIHDVGVAGVHRLLDRIEELKTFDILIVVAGFEGALPTIVGGLLPQPIIAVPTSVGYGVAKNGETALHAMLISCANGISVTNIDNGYGAAMCAFRILNIKR
jgi:NCAIR mutase (PurE)-related protein